MVNLSPDEARICLIALIKVEAASRWRSIPSPWVDATQDKISGLMDKLAFTPPPSSSLPLQSLFPHYKGHVTTPEVVESLAALEHEQWAHWTKHLLDTLGDRYPLSDNDPDIPKWRGKIGTSYSALTEHEKDSDRFWARKALATAVIPMAAVLAQEYRECCSQLRNPSLVNPAWWVGRRCMIEDLTIRLAERGIVVLPELTAARVGGGTFSTCKKGRAD